MEIEYVTTPAERFRDLLDYPFEAHYLKIFGLNMHYVDEGSGRPILLLHGEPTWSFMYRKLISSLAKSFRVVSPDYLGFGMSDKPTNENFYTYETLYKMVCDFVDALDLSHITVVVHDWGGPLGLRYAVDNVKRVDNLVILNTGLYRLGSHLPEGVQRWLSFARRFKEDLPIDKVISTGLVKQVDEKILRGYMAPFHTGVSKVGAYMLPRIVPLHDDDPGAREMDKVAQSLAKWTKPAIVIFGSKDLIFPTTVGQAFADLIPGCVGFVVLDEAAHFVCEDMPNEVFAVMYEFLTNY